VYSVTVPIEARQLESGVAVLTISGRLSLGAEVERLDAAVNELLKKEQREIVFDISALEYCDSSGVGMLVSSMTKVKKAAGVLKIAGANQRIQRIFKITGVDTLVPMFATVAEATAG
jgi:anti-sigma B factor antagonist